MITAAITAAVGGILTLAGILLRWWLARPADPAAAALKGAADARKTDEAVDDMSDDDLDRELRKHERRPGV